MRVISLDEIRPVLEDKSKVLEAVKRSFIEHSEGMIDMSEPIQMMFGAEHDAIVGDCHIKTASSTTLPYFCVKLATGFYNNPAQGLPVNNGLLMLLSSKTGQPVSLFRDGGHMTSVRTAAAGALSASLIKADDPFKLGVVGTGHQAELQARWIAMTNPVSGIGIWGRSAEKMEILSSKLSDLGLPIEVFAATGDLCANSRVVVTTTPATSPVLSAADIQSGLHIIALGSDSPGKVELDPDILRCADVIITDDHQQCLDHGEFGYAVRAGVIDSSEGKSLGAVLSNPRELDIQPNSISVVDLTGLGAQDLALASLVWSSLSQF